MRLFLVLLLFIAFAPARVLAAETAKIPSAAAKRIQAEEQLAQARAKIFDQRSALAASIQEAHRKAGALRTRLQEAQRGRDQAAAELAKRKQDHDRELVQVRQLADRALIAAQLPPDQGKQAGRLPPRERVAAAIAGIEQRVRVLPDKLAGGVRAETVISRRGNLVEVPVMRLGQARAIALGDGHDTRGILARAADGVSWLVTGPALPSIVRVEANGSVHAVALDVDGTVSDQRPAHHRSLAQWIKGGRFFIWPILFVFAIGLAIAVERAYALMRLQVDPRRIVAVARLLHEERLEEAEQSVAARATPLDRILAVGLTLLPRTREAREAALDQALLAEAPRFQRGIAFILVMAGIAPLLGLLGTVTGMIDMFSVIAQQGSGNAKSLSGAISEALITTQAGMIAAIPLLLIHAALARKVERRMMLLEEAACSLLGLDAPQRAKSAETTAVS